MSENNELLELVSSAGEGPVLFHSDIFKVMGLVGKSSSPKVLLNSHLNFIEKLSSGRGVVLPTFNYDFTKTKVYDVRESESQVGALSDHARRDWSEWRSLTPVFNFCGDKASESLLSKGGQVADGQEVDPFDEASLFNALYENDGVVVMYGAPFQSFTGIHYIEHRSGRPLYRYDKYFPGKVIDWDGKENNVNFKYHVRPLNVHVDYRWRELLDFSISKGAVKEHIRPKVSVYVISFREICDLWVSELSNDPLFLLDEESKKFVEPKLKELGRRFKLEDFE
ncbi:AAC(3) family N-acetyltransferase [Halomonas saccharevitans]|uniref:Aminoglycoside N(3)-acetyltransferase n=1 Tax=Halomonas saccharevitans TaxID=416872 RepID=A0A1I7CIR0_9GAMM|nr:AAC(3) family N-acetyltransferase [Halomonas saccharevitans]SFT99292.1 Aminoglycoside N3'-acetyltransferase [Halomonas saccharevitans]